MARVTLAPILITDAAPFPPPLHNRNSANTFGTLKEAHKKQQAKIVVMIPALASLLKIGIAMIPSDR